MKKEKQQLNLELAEIREISEIMFRKLETKIRDVQAIEASVEKKKIEFDRLLGQADALDNKIRAGQDMVDALDRKIASLQQMLQYAETVNPEGDAMNRQQEIVALIRKGLASREIAEVLDMPQGEVELIVELNRHTA